MEADVHEDVVAVEDVESEEQWVLHLPEVRDDERVERPDDSRYPNQHETETELVVCVSVGTYQGGL